MSAGWWTCGRCGWPIDDSPHTDPQNGDDVHEECCASCRPGLAEQWGIDLEVTTDDLRLHPDGGRDPARDDDGQVLIAGHGSLTQDQAARGERGSGMTDVPALARTVSPIGRWVLRWLGEVDGDPSWLCLSHEVHPAARAGLVSRGLIVDTGEYLWLTDLGRQVLDHLEGAR